MARKAAAKKSEPEDKTQMRREVWPLRNIHEWPDNPKTHPPAQVALLADLLKQYGPDQDIVVDEGGVIIKGHGRKLAAALAGLDEFPVTIREGLSEPDKVALRIADNQVPLLGGWNRELVGAQITQLKTAGFPVALLGFGEQQIVQFTTTPGPPPGFQAYGEDLPVAYCCPKCQYSWSGNPLAGRDDPAAIAEAKKVKKK